MAVSKDPGNQCIECFCDVAVAAELLENRVADLHLVQQFGRLRATASADQHWWCGSLLQGDITAPSSGTRMGTKERIEVVDCLLVPVLRRPGLRHHGSEHLVQPTASPVALQHCLADANQQQSRCLDGLFCGWHAGARRLHGSLPEA